MTIETHDSAQRGDAVLPGNQRVTQRGPQCIAHRIAMWSGPRNLSTALMRSFASRTDCAVWDEPYYAAYLAASGMTHPMRAEILAGHEVRPEHVVRRILGPVPHGKPVFYQKHMAHHMLPQFDLAWTREVTNVILIRAPEYVLASYTSKRAEVSLDDLGYRQLVSLYRALASCPGVAAPVVVDASDLSAAPGVVLKALCARIGIGYTDDMLTWAPGPRPEDGIWARHWYAAVRRSNGLEPKPRAALPELEPGLANIARAARPLYEELAAARLIVAPG